MCGITGFCDFKKSSSVELLKKMTDSLIHRGPDDYGLKLYELPFAQLGIGMRRLAVIDLSASGHQPMVFQHLTITYNGEIYNYKELREELILKGYEFQSTSDTEVILLGYHFWGPSVVNRFIGMFTFVIFDSIKNELTFFRDRAGVKPLYYYWDGSILLWSSELKSFHEHPGFTKEIDIDSLALFLQYGYVPVPYCIFKLTHKLRPGHFLRVNLSTKKITCEAYWDVFDSYKLGILDLPENEIIDETEKIMQSAYRYRMVSDVPVGIFLSGGYDSASVAAILQGESNKKIDTFTVGFNEQEFNEAPAAKKIAEFLGTNHDEIYVTSVEALNVLPSLPYIYDEPFADNSVVPTVLVSRLASKKVKVALSADGGDEIFAGYKKYFESIKATENVPRWLQPVLSRSMSFINPEFIPYFNNKYNFSTKFEKCRLAWESGNIMLAQKYHSQHLTEKELLKILPNTIARLPTTFDLHASDNLNLEKLNSLLALDYKTFLLDNNLVKVDRATMSVSVEGREPMVDHRLVEFLSRVPAAIKVKNGEKKYLLKQIVHKYIPKELMDRPKMPFIAPLSAWLKGGLREFLKDYINDQTLSSTGLFNEENIIKMRDRYLSGETENYQKLWNILIFMLWYEAWIA